MFYVIVYTSHNGIEFKRGGAGAEGGMAYVNAKLGNNFLFSKRIGIFYWAYWAYGALGAYGAYGLMGWEREMFREAAMGSFSRREAVDMAQGFAS